MSSPNKIGSNKILPLTSLRFFAAFYVVLFHTLLVTDPSLGHKPLLSQIVLHGYVSVSFFFVLSGYILAVVYLKSGRQMDPGRFWISRFARIYPLFLVTLLLDAPNYYLMAVEKYPMKTAASKVAGTIFGNCLMLQAWVMKFHKIDGPNWSLAVETVFYLSFPVLGPILWKLQKQKLVLVFGAIYAVGLSLVIAAPRFHMSSEAIDYNPILHLHEFLLGILLAKIEAGFSDITAVRNWIRKWSLPLTIAGMLVFAYCMTVPSLPRHLLSDGLLVPLFCVIIILFAAGGRVINALFATNWLVILGEASFALYLVHIPIWHLFEHMQWAHRLSLYPVYLASCIFVSLISFYFLEKPAREWITSWFASRATVREHALVMTE